MKILTAFFSGTGNTSYCAEYLGSRLRAAGAEVSVRSIEAMPKADIAEFDTLIFGFPVYACDLPDIVRDYLQGIPLTADGKAYLFCTKALGAGNALKKAARMLGNAGYRVFGHADVTMPGSDGLVFLRKDSAAVKKMTGRDFHAIRPLDRMTEQILSGIRDPAGSAAAVPEKPIRTKVTGVLADGLSKMAYGPISRRVSGSFYADDNCVKCGLCETVCPARNIIVTKTGVFFSSRCFLCMRCINQCPKEAIQIGKGTVGKMRWKGPDNDFDPLKQNG